MIFSIMILSLLLHQNAEYDRVMILGHDSRRYKKQNNAAAVFSELIVTVYGWQLLVNLAILFNQYTLVHSRQTCLLFDKKEREYWTEFLKEFANQDTTENWILQILSYWCFSAMNHSCKWHFLCFDCLFKIDYAVRLVYNIKWSLLEQQLYIQSLKA